MKSKLFKSKFLHSVKNNNGQAVYYHSLYGNARQIDCNTGLILDFFENGNTVEHLINELSISEEEIEIVNYILEDFIEAKFLIKEYEDERGVIVEDNKKFIEFIMDGFPFEFIGFSVTDKCNFACNYCIAGANKVKDCYYEFDRSKLKSYLCQFADELIEHKKKKMGIGFTGGEPLLYWKELKEVISDIYNMYSDDLEIQIAINTNASLITEEIAKFFKTYNIKPSTSLDGIETWNNRVRVYKNGKSTFNDIMRGIKNLRKNGVACDSFYLTLTKDNFGFDVNELVKFAKVNEFKSITIEPDLVNVLEINVEKICNKLIECHQVAKQNQIEIVGFWKRPYTNMTDYSKSTNGFCRALESKSIVVNKDGYIVPCGYSDLKISKVNKFQDIIKDERYINFIVRNLRGAIEKCKGCEIEGVCKGGCLISREIGQKNDEVFIYRCDIYRTMTKMLLKEAQFEE